MSEQSNARRLFVASSNPGKLREYLALAEGAGAQIEMELLPDFEAVPTFEETAPTFAENAAGKALYYSQFAKGLVLADDSGLVVPALGGAPGVYSARYAGVYATDAERVSKLLHEMREKRDDERRAQFVCVLVLAEAGEARALFSASAEGTLLDAPQGAHGFGYDPIFYFPELGKTYAEISREEKNLHSHRGKAFRKALEYLMAAQSKGSK